MRKNIFEDKLSLAEWLLTITLLVGILMANAWHHLHVSQPQWDDAAYLEASFKLFYAAQEGFSSFVHQYTHLLDYTAPLIAVLPLPLYFLFGPSERSALWINDFALIVTWFSVYQIGRKFYGKRAGLVSVLAIALIPLVYGLSRIYLIEIILMMMVVATQAVLLEENSSEGAKAIKLGVLLGLGLLTKTIFPLYMAGTFFLYRRWLFRQAPTVVGIAMTLALTWYFSHAQRAIPHLFRASWGDAARGYSSPDIFSPKVFVGYFKLLAEEAFSYPYVVFALGSLFLAKGLQKTKWRPSFPEKFLTLWFLIPFLGCLFVINKDTRYLVPAFPALAIALGALISSLSYHHIGRWWCLVGGVILVGFFSTQTFGVPPGHYLKFNGPPGIEEVWDRRAVIDAIHSQTDGQRTVIGLNFDYPAFNFNNLSSLATLLQNPFYFLNLNSASSLQEVVGSLHQSKSRYLLVVRGALPSNMDARLNRRREEIQNWIEQNKSYGEKVASVLLTHHFGDVWGDLYRLNGNLMMK